MRSRARRVVCLVACIGVSLLVPLRFAVGATYVAPRHLGEIAVASDAIVLARAGAAAIEEHGRLVFRRVPFLVVESLGGALRPGDDCEVKVPGGRLDDGSGWLVPGSPVFRDGAVYLLFLQQVREGREWIPKALAYGLLEEVFSASGAAFLVPVDRGAGAVLPRPDGVVPEPIGVYSEDRLLDLLARVLSRGEPWRGEEAEATPAELALLDPAGSGAGAPAGCSFFTDEFGRPLRWRVFDQGGGRAEIAADETGDLSRADGGIARVVDAMNMWMDIERTGLNLVLSGTAQLGIGCGGGQNAQANTIVFNDPCSDMGDLDGCAGILAFGGPLVDGTVHTHDGGSWLTVDGWIAVVNDGSGCLGDGNYSRMIAHELGHGLGWGHVDDSGAMMFASCCRSVNSTDRLCAQFTYPAIDSGNRRPDVDVGGDRRLVLAGNIARVSGAVSDDGLPGDPGRVTTRWRRLAGPGTVVFEDSGALETFARFSRSGRYVIGLEASDGQLLRTAAFTAEVQIFSGSRGVAVFAQGRDGYRGTRDTFLQESAPSADNALVTELSVDADDPANSNQASHVLLVFDKIFGPGSRQVPPGASIRSASLHLESTNLGDGAELFRLVQPWETNAAWTDFGPSGVEPGVHVEAPGDAVVAGLSDCVTVDVTASLAAWSRDPCANHGWAFLPRGDDGWDFFSAEGAVPPELVVEYPLAPSERFIEAGDLWQYFEGVNSPQEGWREPGFTPGSGWQEGRTGIGYGDGDDATVLAGMRGRYAVVFCRRSFDIATAERVESLTLRVDYDDGFVAFLNGREVVRSSTMGAAGDPAERTTFARDAHEAGVFEEYAIAADHLRAGENVLAIQVHNRSLDSSDLSFDCTLEAQSAVLSSRALWRFRRGSQSVPDGWQDPDFDDAAWEVGTVGIGYGDGDDITVLEDMRDAYASVFCRSEFEATASDRERGLIATVVHDDGVVVYLNGEEIGRRNTPAGPVTRSTTAVDSIEPTPATFTLPSALLREGRNVFAASVHNSSLDSSDLSFMAVAVPHPPPAREVRCDRTEPAFRRGDVTDDGVLDVSDGINLLNHLFLGAREPVCHDSADVDDDGALGLTDAVILFNYLFLEGIDPAPPGPTCGTDPTPDDFGECATSSC